MKTENPQQTQWADPRAKGKLGKSHVLADATEAFPFEDDFLETASLSGGQSLS
jgi:hypothetical protein